MIVEKSFPIKPEFSPIWNTKPFASVLPFLKILVDGKILHHLPGERLRSQGWLDDQMVLETVKVFRLPSSPPSTIFPLPIAGLGRRLIGLGCDVFREGVCFVCFSANIGLHAGGFGE